MREGAVDMFEQSGALSLRGNGLKRGFSIAVSKIFVEEVVCMIVNDREALDQQLKVFRRRMFKVRDLVYRGTSMRLELEP